MTSELRAAAERALEALTNDCDWRVRSDAATALRRALDDELGPIAAMSRPDGAALAAEQPQPEAQLRDSYDAIWNALQRIDTAAASLPTYAVNHDGGIEAFTQNIVDAILRALAEQPQPEAQPVAWRYKVDHSRHWWLSEHEPAKVGEWNTIVEAESLYTATQMRDYARALAAEQPQPVGHLHSNGDFCQERNVVPDRWPMPLYAAPPAAAPSEAQDAARYRWIREHAKEELVRPETLDSEFPDMRTHWVLPALIAYGPVGGPTCTLDEAIDAALAAAAKERG